MLNDVTKIEVGFGLIKNFAVFSRAMQGRIREFQTAASWTQEVH